MKVNIDTSDMLYAERMAADLTVRTGKKKLMSVILFSITIRHMTGDESFLATATDASD